MLKSKNVLKVGSKLQRHRSQPEGTTNDQFWYCMNNKINNDSLGL